MVKVSLTDSICRTGDPSNGQLVKVYRISDKVERINDEHGVPKILLKTGVLTESNVQRLTQNPAATTTVWLAKSDFSIFWF